MNRKLKYSLCIIALSFMMNTPVKIFAANGTIKAREIHQTMIGFGAAIAWADGDLTSHPQKDEIYNYIFDDLGLDILRLRNIYRNDPVDFAPTFAEIVSKMNELSPTKPKILISSWSPPYDIKSNYGTNGGGNATLKKNSITNQYMYGEFAKYWVDALKAYKAIGIEPDYISIQNEPSFDASWESCRFDPTEGTVAAYGKALDSVYSALQQADLHPKILASECHGIGYNTFQNYALHFNHSIVDGYAYHLYHGDNGSMTSTTPNPDAFNTNLSTVGAGYNDKPIWQTEFDRGDWLQTAWLIHNCVVNGNVSAYLWWELVWGSGGKPLIEMQSSTYTITKYYWAFRQYSKFISSGWKRVTANDDSDSLRMSAFINSNGNKLTAVVLNIGSQTQSMNFDIQDFSIDSGMVIRTSETESGVEVSTNYNGRSPLNIPARSITTLSFSGELVTSVNDGLFISVGFSLSQNYPNPFNPSTTIDYSLAKESFVQLKIYDVLGREITTLVQERKAAGKHTIQFDAKDMNSGIYFYKIMAGDFIQSHKMIVIK